MQLPQTHGGGLQRMVGPRFGQGFSPWCLARNEISNVSGAAKFLRIRRVG